MSSNQTRNNPGHVLVTGSGGQLGTEWVRALKQENIPHTHFRSGELDITNESQVFEKISSIKPDLIINAAAYTNVDKAETEKDMAFAVNAEGVAHLAKAAKKTGALLVHYSTDYVFSGSLNDRETWPAGYPEEAPADPVNSYGASKRRGEELLMEHGGDWLLIRVSWLCSAFGHNFIKTVQRICKEKGEMRIVNDQFGSPTYTADVVEKTLALTSAGERGIFHVASEGEISWYDFGCEIARQSGLDASVHPIPSEDYPTPAPRPSFSLLNCSKLIGCGCHQQHWKEGLQEIIQQMNG